ncbi:MAG: heme o synthase [Bacteriovoracaceae bacterium]
MNRALTWSVWISTFILLMLGAQLQVLKQSLVCPDWPMCFGQLTPLMGPAFYESTHRFIAGFVLILTLMWTFFHFSALKFKAIIPLMIVITQSLLGAVTFFYKLPTITSILHLALSLLFAGSILVLHQEESKKDFTPRDWDPRFKDGALWLLLFLLTQIIFGGILRKASLIQNCEESMSWWSCWMEQAKIPLAGHLSLVHRFFGLFLVMGGVGYAAWLSRSSFFLKRAILLGALFLLQGGSGIYLGRILPIRYLILIHFAIGFLIFTLLLWHLTECRLYERKFLGKIIPTFLNDVMDLFKPKLTILVVVTVLMGVFLAPLTFNIVWLIIGLLGIWIQAAGSLCLNCYLERDVDAKMERTKDRPLPAGRLSPVLALNIGITTVIVGTLLIWWAGNLLTAVLGLAAVLSYVYLYTPMKPLSPYALYVGAVPGAIPTLMGWTFVTNAINGLGFYLFGILFLWQIPHFIAISIYRDAEYRAAGLKTFAETQSRNYLIATMIGFTSLIVMTSILPYQVGLRGGIYAISSLILGIPFLGLSFYGFWTKGTQGLSVWARSYFFATIVYLPLQLTALLILT